MSARRSPGFTLIELMIAMAIGVVLISGAVTLFAAVRLGGTLISLISLISLVLVTAFSSEVVHSSRSPSAQSAKSAFPQAVARTCGP